MTLWVGLILALFALSVVEFRMFGFSLSLINDKDSNSI